MSKTYKELLQLINEEMGNSVQEKLLNITNNWMNANQNHNEMLPHIC